MIEMSDIPVEEFRVYFASLGVPVAFLVPTPTGYKKSIMDAVSDVRYLLKETGVHDYEKQEQGPSNKVMNRAIFVHPDCYRDTQVSLYRPCTKKGDPRIWFRNLKKYCEPKNLLALLVIDKIIFVINLSSEKIRNSFYSLDGFVHKTVLHALKSETVVADELLGKLKDIHAEGFIPAVNYGPTTVGMTLEHALDIPPNSSKKPDYKGIELKATRKVEEFAYKNRVNLFSQVPDWKLSQTSAGEIINKYGYWADNKGTPRFNLYCTVEAGTPNPQGLFFKIDDNSDWLVNYYSGEQNNRLERVAIWPLEKLRSRLKEKHKETFWVAAKSIVKNGKEYFRYDIVTHTKKPNVFMLPELINNHVITMDYTMHIKKDSEKVRDHGYLFKIKPDKMNLLFPVVEKILLGDDLIN